MKRVLAVRGVDAASPADTFRKAAPEGLIDDPEVWFAFQKKYTLTLHIYESENLVSIVAIFDEFSRELEALIGRLKEVGADNMQNNFVLSKDHFNQKNLH